MLPNKNNLIAEDIFTRLGTIRFMDYAKVQRLTVIENGLSIRIADGMAKDNVNAIDIILNETGTYTVTCLNVCSFVCGSDSSKSEDVSSIVNNREVSKESLKQFVEGVIELSNVRSKYDEEKLREDEVVNLTVTT